MFWKMSLSKRICWLLGGGLFSFSLYFFVSESIGAAVLVVFLATVVLPIYMSGIYPSPYDDDDTND
ncbi:MAG: hypothetical protein Q7T14_09390, partial [Aestuariivirga sp.]|nr:hypothetical protein [Aestuariivirga sp.]